jgi:hypothetical protein
MEHAKITQPEYSLSKINIFVGVSPTALRLIEQRCS